jgi:hypothetical protein
VGLDRGHVKSWSWDRDPVVVVGYRFGGEPGLIVAVQVRSCGSDPITVQRNDGSNLGHQISI